jgi:hypothetical protein
MTTKPLSAAQIEPLVQLFSQSRDDETRIRDLLRIAIEALAIKPPDYPRSIFGPPETWLHPSNGYSEFTMIDPRQPSKALRYLRATSLITLPLAAPGFVPTLLSNLFFHPTQVIPPKTGDQRFPEETWFFINGIMTNEDVAKLKEWDVMTEPLTVALPVIHRELQRREKTKVVLIAHSQGTIIAGDVLEILKDLVKKESKEFARGGLSSATLRYDAAVQERQEQSRSLARAWPEGMQKAAEGLSGSRFDSLEPLSLDELKKLEIYCFANCASTMTQYERGVPLIESFGNEKDIVARLGMLSKKGAIEIHGSGWKSRNAWGHLLNEHYLTLIEAARQGLAQGKGHGYAFFEPPGAERHPAAGAPTPEKPRLMRYLDGAKTGG